MHIGLYYLHHSQLVCHCSYNLATNGVITCRQVTVIPMTATVIEMDPDNEDVRAVGEGEEPQVGLRKSTRTPAVSEWLQSY